MHAPYLVILKFKTTDRTFPNETHVREHLQLSSAQADAGNLKTYKHHALDVFLVETKYLDIPKYNPGAITEAGLSADGYAYD